MDFHSDSNMALMDHVEASRLATACDLSTLRRGGHWLLCLGFDALLYFFLLLLALRLG